MGFLGVILMIQGFGGLVARQFFDRDFGLLDNWFSGGALTAVQVAVGLVGLIILLLSVRRSDDS
ncbi:hypothetical protein [Nonomuraea soli]|uniref:Uncharacterized protein n=1 Tax=Nonomuraea soli TaxID=1032476 RepID=A0A7W0CG43_9ACTN|nr:hypothetical protein [Nonomuraea soli]MBA2890539.1 hypothetical protein [Nonomuraea soli]